MGSRSILQRIFLTQESTWDPLHCGRILRRLSQQGRPQSERAGVQQTKSHVINTLISSSVLTTGALPTTGNCPPTANQLLEIVKNSRLSTPLYTHWPIQSQPPSPSTGALTLCGNIFLIYYSRARHPTAGALWSPPRRELAKLCLFATPGLRRRASLPLAAVSRGSSPGAASGFSLRGCSCRGARAPALAGSVVAAPGSRAWAQ